MGLKGMNGMRGIGRFINKLSVRIITMIILSVGFLIALSGIFTYRVFSRILLKETYSYLQEVADSTIYNIAQFNFYYLVAFPDDFEEIALMDEEELEARANDLKVQAYMAYSKAVGSLMYQAMSFDLDRIMLLIPLPETGYSEYKALYGQIVDYDNEIADNYILGEVVQTESEEESRIIKRIWTDEIECDFIVDYQEKNSSITLYKAVRNSEEELCGVIIISRSIQEMVDTWTRYLVGNAIAGVSLVLIGTVILGLYIRFHVVKPVIRLAMEADRFTREIVKRERELADDVGNVTEIRFLARSIDKMEEGTMKNIEDLTRMSRESERMDTELSLAANLQTSVLPKAEKLSDREEFDLAASMTPAREVGGDFYDFFLLDDTHLVLTIADVSDKGVGAAFFMAISKTMLRARVRMGGNPAEIISFVEERLSEDNEAGMFITAWMGIVDLVTGEVNACNAGHNFPAVLHVETGEGYRLEKTPHGPPMCFLPGMPQMDHSFCLRPGDRLFLYTDGVTDAKNTEGDRFGNDRLVEALNADQEIGDASLILRIKAAVDHFAGEEPQYDDISMVSFTFHGRKS